MEIQSPDLFSNPTPSGTFDLFHQGGESETGLLEFSDKDSAKTVKHDYKLVETEEEIKAFIAQSIRSAE